MTRAREPEHTGAVERPIYQYKFGIFSIYAVCGDDSVGYDTSLSRECDLHGRQILGVFVFSVHVPRLPGGSGISRSVW